MRVVRLRLHAFRNHSESLLRFDEGPVVVCGPNGAGKTGVLEAVHLLATGSSFRTSDLDILVSTGAERALVEAEMELAGERSVRIGAALGDVSPARRWMLNGTPRPRHSDVALLRAVVFAPDDLRLVKGGPSERREFLDDALVSVKPRTVAVVGDYQRVLKQRNALLRSLKGSRAGHVPPALDTWTEMLSDKGADLVVERVQLLQRLAPRIAAAVQELSGEEAGSGYSPSWDRAAHAGALDHLVDREAVRAGLAHELATRFREEIDRGVTLVGAHRDDVALTFAGRDVRTHASQGEQRVVSLALRLAHLGVLGEVADDPPVLLLDDVFSELDPERRARLLDQLPRGAQTFLTTTSDADAGGMPAEVAAALDASGLDGGVTPQVVRVVGGKVFDGA